LNGFAATRKDDADAAKLVSSSTDHIPDGIIRPVETTDGNRAPNLLPATLVLSVVLWLFTMTGGGDIFIKEVLGGAYDSQAEHFLRGDVGVDSDAIAHEAMIVNGHVRMYFGPFPAFIRIPLNFIYPAGHAKWSRISGFCAGVIALFAFAGLMRMALRSSSLSSRARNWLGNTCLIGFALGSPVVFLIGNLSIYSEPIIWGLALSLAALHFALRARECTGAAFTRSLLGFSFCAAAALLARVTFGLPFLFIAPLLAIKIPRDNRMVNFSALALPLTAALTFYSWLSYARFGSFTGLTYDYYINPDHREYARQHGIFNLTRVPYSFGDYFSLAPPSLNSKPPLFRVGRHYLPVGAPFSLDFSETFLSVPWCSGWLVLGAILGIACLLRSPRTDFFQRAVAIALLTQFVCVLSYFALAQRYTADLYPFLIFCFSTFLAAGGIAVHRTRYLLVGLVGISIIINLFATAFWLGSDPNLPTETQIFWSVIAGMR
jgi:hypothetical protein